MQTQLRRIATTVVDSLLILSIYWPMDDCMNSMKWITVLSRYKELVAGT